MNKILVSLFTSLLICSFSFAQDATKALVELEKYYALYDSTLLIPLADLNICVGDAPKPLSDVSVTRWQPEKEFVIEHLKEIVSVNNSDDFERVKRIFDIQLAYFEFNWSTIWRSNAVNKCELANDQFEVLKTFEQVLFSLELKNKSRRKKFRIHKKICKNNWLLLNNPTDYVKITNRYPSYSEYFYSLKKPHWFYKQSTIHYLDPYLEELEEYFINDLWKSKKGGIEQAEISFIQQNKNFYFLFDDPRVSQFFIDDIEFWYNQKKYYLLLEFAMHSSENELLKELSSTILFAEFQKLYPELKSNFNDYYLRLILKKPAKAEVVRMLLIDSFQQGFSKENIFAVQFLKYFPDDTSAELVIAYLQSDVVSTNEKKKIVQGIKSTFLKSDEVSSSWKDRIEAQLLNVENKN